MNAKTFLLSLLLLIFFSCKKEITTESLIYGGDDGYKYWLIEHDSLFDIESSFYDEDPRFFLYFDKYGKCLYFYINPIGEFVYNEPPPDVVIDKTWSLPNDSTITTGYYSQRLVKITKDTMVLFNDYSKKDELYITAPDSLIPKEYKRFQTEY